MTTTTAAGSKTFDVSAGTECAAGSGQNDAANRWILSQTRQCFKQTLDHLACHRVPRLWTVHG
jgi:hypothetical protein